MPKLPLARSILLLFFIILISAFFVRVYRTDDLLRFYYDQGRDALVVEKMIHDFRPVLVGPTTGLAGILRGPAFYYLLTPAYAVSLGNPIAAAVWLQLINIVGLVFVYASAVELLSPLSGIIALFLMAFSAYVVDLSRWLSNPSPILTTVPILLYGLIQIRKKRYVHIWWPIVALTCGLSLQFEIASEFWFIPTILILMLVYKEMRPTRTIFTVSFLVFLATLLPQVAFDIRHNGIMSEAIIKHFTSSKEASFAFNLDSINQRLSFYLDSFTSLLSPGRQLLTMSLIGLYTPLLFIKDIRRRLSIPSALLFLPLLILLFYQGNQGNFYSYYLIGLYPLFLIITACVLAYYAQKRYFVLFPLVIILVFTVSNFKLLKDFLYTDVNNVDYITFANQTQAINWIYQDVSGKPFNTDVYVPPIVPAAYDYLIPWFGKTYFYHQPSGSEETLLYTLWEENPNNPEEVDTWLKRQSTYGKVQQSKTFGMVHVEQRIRKSAKIKN